MKFICGHCNELIHEAPSTVAFPGWQRHEKCGYETYFEKFVYSEKYPDKQPSAIETRRFRDETAEEVEARLKAGAPSAADLDAVAEEQKAKEATEGSAVLADFENHKTMDDAAADAQKAVDEHLNPPTGSVE